MRPGTAIAGTGALIGGLVGLFFSISGDDPRSRRSNGRLASEELTGPSRAGEANGERGEHDASLADAEGSVEDGGEDVAGTGKKVRITGIVLENNAPVSGAAVQAHNDTETGATALSGDDGRFSIDIRAKYFVRIDAVKGELRGSARASIEMAAPKDLRIELRHAGVVIVTVTSRRENGPVQGARVQCRLVDEGDGRLDPLTYDQETAEREFVERWFGPVETDRNGRARLLILKPGNYDIEAEHDRLGNLVRRHALSIGSSPQEIVLELPGGSAVFGRVLNEVQEPIADVEVWLAPEKRQAFGYRRSKSDPAGRFRFDGVEAGKFYLEARPTRYIPGNLEIDKKDDINDLEVDLILSAGGTIEGRALGVHDAPAVGRKVQALMQSREHGFIWRTAAVGKDGSFVLEGLPPGVYVLGLAGPGEGSISFSSRADEARARPGDRDVVLRVAESARLQGEVRFEGADPPATYTVSVMRDKKEQHPGSSPTFVIDYLSPGPATLSVTAPGFGGVSRNVNLKEGETETVSLTLRPSIRVKGLVLDRHGPPVDNALVRVTKRTGSVMDLDDKVPAARTASDGSFALEGVAPGPLELIVRADSYVTEIAGPFDVSPETPALIVKLTRGVRVAGRVHAGSRLPQSGSVSIRSSSEVSFRWHLGQEAELGADGAYSVEGVATGKSELDVEAQFEDGSSPSKSLPLDVPSSGVVGLDIDFAGPGARLVASMPPALDRGMFLSLAEGHLEPEAGGPPQNKFWQNATASKGQAEVVFNGLREGEYTLWVEAIPGMFEDDGAQRLRSPIYVTIGAGQAEARVTVPAH